METGMEDIQSWYEVPAIAHFCSLLRKALDLPDLDIQDVEEALLTSTTLDGAETLLNLVAALLNGIFATTDIDELNYRPFMVSVLEINGKESPMKEEDTDFLDLSLRTKVEILWQLIHSRVDAADVPEKLKGFDGDSLRLHPLGQDGNGALYWYFYGANLYKEDPVPPPEKAASSKKSKKKKEKDKKKKGKGRRGKNKEEEEAEERDLAVHTLKDVDPSRWHLVAANLEQWESVTKSFKGSKHSCERHLYRTFRDDFLPEIPKIIEVREKAVRRRLLETAPKRSSGRLVKKKQEREEQMKIAEMLEAQERVERMRIEQERRQQADMERQIELARAREERIRAKEERARRLLLREQRGALLAAGEEIPPELRYGHGIDSGSSDEESSSEDEANAFSEDDLLKMSKILEKVRRQKDAVAFEEPVTEDVAPDYFTVVDQPMDLSTMESKVDMREYKSRDGFLKDFDLIVSNCYKYNGDDQIYYASALRLQKFFLREVNRVYPDSKTATKRKRTDDSDEEFTVKRSKVEPKLSMYSAFKSNPRRQASTRARQRFLEESSEESDEADYCDITPKRNQPRAARHTVIQSSSSSMESRSASPSPGPSQSASPAPSQSASPKPKSHPVANHRRPFPSSSASFRQRMEKKFGVRSSSSPKISAARQPNASILRTSNNVHPMASGHSGQASQSGSMLNNQGSHGLSNRPEIKPTPVLPTSVINMDTSSSEATSLPQPSNPRVPAHGVVISPSAVRPGLLLSGPGFNGIPVSRGPQPGTLILPNGQVVSEERIRNAALQKQQQQLNQQSGQGLQASGVQPNTGNNSTGVMVHSQTPNSVPVPMDVRPPHGFAGPMTGVAPAPIRVFSAGLQAQNMRPSIPGSQQQQAMTAAAAGVPFIQRPTANGSAPVVVNLMPSNAQAQPNTYQMAPGFNAQTSLGNNCPAQWPTLVQKQQPFPNLMANVNQHMDGPSNTSQPSPRK